MRDPHQNIFFYYRGPSKEKEGSLYDFQVEDNTTKSLINILEFCYQAGFGDLLKSFLKTIYLSARPAITFKLQKGLDESRPDGVIDLIDYKIHIESKVKAGLGADQIKRHLKCIGPKDILLVITNNKENSHALKKIGDRRIRYLQWAEVHRICIRTIESIQRDKKLSAITQLIKQFVDYMEVVVMTEFSGFKNEDFDFWIDPNPYYVPILRKKLQSLANIIKEKLPKGIRNKYSFIKAGNISRDGEDGRCAWVAIKKPKNRDRFNQCNFTIEVSKSSLDINAVIRNGRTYKSRTAVGGFFARISDDPKSFLRVIKRSNKEARIVISKRLPKFGNRIMPGNEKWKKFFDMKLCDVNNKKDVSYLCDILKKADGGSGAPGIHFRYSIDRGEKILSDPGKLQREIINTIIEFKPILDYLVKFRGLH